MESCFLNKKGNSILEVTAVLFVVGVVLSMVIFNYVYRIQNANYQRTVNELTTIAQASVDYYISGGSWPTRNKINWPPQFMTRAVTSSPFGTNYQISCVNNVVTASVCKSRLE